ncbi:MAG: SpoIIE family protein phosphatase [Candidatus Tectomicrobia bacterium]|uniref:SpoIIE family protein phosphatase n=1 Tax=Tectimicrobiota bacterium TaxID=2528274 RepID=A0A932I2J6_UNCTE|nr:SpoIIE family protein phosphatase [Candidatus Tectomicrobia bacterium]
MRTTAGARRAARAKASGTAREMEALRERVDSLSRLMEVTALISSTLDLDEVLQRVMKLAKEIMGAEAASVMLWNEAEQCLEFQTSVGGVGVEELKTIRILKGQGIAGSVMESGQPLLVADVSKDPRFFSKADEKTGFVTRSILAAPLIVHDKVVGVGEVLNHTDGRPFSELDLQLFSSFCRQVAVAIENARLHRSEVRRHLLDQQMEMAASIQKSFLPAALPVDRAGRFELGAFSRSAQEVGGDLYCVSSLPDGRLGACVGDVSGKGIPAALYMARVVSEFRLFSSGGAPAGEVLASLNQSLGQGGTRGMFVTFAYAVLNPATGALHVANAGHLPLILAEKKGGARFVGGAAGPPVGMLPRARFQEEEVRLAPGDTVLIYSDGILEARGKDRELFGEERLLAAAAAAPRGASGLLSGVHQAVERFTQDEPQADDMTMVSLSWGG